MLLFVIIEIRRKKLSGIRPINSTNKKPFLRSDNTGYAALTGLCLTTASAMTKNKSVRKCHKPLGIITAGLTILHLGTILYNRYQWQKKLKETSS